MLGARQNKGAYISFFGGSTQMHFAMLLVYLQAMVYFTQCQFKEVM
jgi:hypothetical protein